VVWLLFKHPNIVPFYGVRRTRPSDPVDLVSKWMAHGELTSFLARHPEQNPLRYIRDVVSGLEFIHSLGMVHGDLKGVCYFNPRGHSVVLTFSQRNVLVDEHHRACIADFGHTSTMQRTGLATSNIASRDGPGTIAFIAPELLRDGDSDNDPELTAFSDIYALGILIWEVSLDPLRLSAYLLTLW
jgi:serine/threonine protein kinase